MNQFSKQLQLERDLQRLEVLTDLLDSRFTIPGSRIRFGLDFLIGLIPFAGDVVTFAISGMLVAFMVRHGASGELLARMIGNILLDAILGSIPLIGDVFDLQFKANRRNLKLLKAYHERGRHRGSWSLVIGVLLSVTILLFGMVFLLLYIGLRLIAGAF